MARQNGNYVLRQLRTQLNLTQRQMAEETGLSSGFICQVETGVEALGRDGALAILDAYRAAMAELRLTLEDLLRGSRSGKSA